MTTSWHCMMSCCRHADSSGSWSVLPAGLTCCRDTALSSTCYQYLYMYCDGKYDPWYSRKCYHMHKAVCTMLSLTVPPFWTTCTQHYQLVVHYTTTCSLTTLDTQHWEWTSWRLTRGLLNLGQLLSWLLTEHPPVYHIDHKQCTAPYPVWVEHTEQHHWQVIIPTL